ncbi:MAG: iron chelate uptake ABC transporter family permease subunit [Cardiobacteriaceae bacterium]|nr:iron chelate uptake ABC transporter family permease subunit [Cardiobacteriaceae bacterium]
MNALLEPLQYPFMQQALLMAISVSLPCALLSCYIVLKGWALMGDAIAHGILPGIVLAAWAGAPLWSGAFAAGLICALGSGYLQRHSTLRPDTLLGIVFAAMFALGILLYRKIDSAQHLTHILFGNLLGIDAATRTQVLVMSALVILILAVKGRDFLLFIFDDIQARVAGLPVNRLNLLLLALLALAVVAALPAVGVILVVAMLITPGVSAQLVAKRFRDMLIIASLLATIASSGGILASFHLDASPAACIVLLQSALFLLMLALRQWRIRQGRLG